MKHKYVKNALNTKEKTMKSKNRIRLFPLLIAFVFAGCAHTPRGTVAMKVNPGEAHVVLGVHEVKVGDRVAFFKNQCKKPLGGVHQGVHNDPVCERVKIGEGRVTRVINESYSVVHVDPGVEISEGMIVERRG